MLGVAVAATRNGGVAGTAFRGGLPLLKEPSGFASRLVFVGSDFVDGFLLEEFRACATGREVSFAAVFAAGRCFADRLAIRILRDRVRLGTVPADFSLRRAPCLGVPVAEAVVALHRGLSVRPGGAHVVAEVDRVGDDRSTECHHHATDPYRPSRSLRRPPPA